MYIIPLGMYFSDPSQSVDFAKARGKGGGGGYIISLKLVYVYKIRCPELMDVNWCKLQDSMKSKQKRN